MDSTDTPDTVPVPPTPTFGTADLTFGQDVMQPPPQAPAQAPAPVPDPNEPKVQVHTPDGGRGTVPRSSLQDAIDKGYQPFTSQELVEEKYPGFGNKALGFVEEALGAGTAGLSKVLEKQFGVAPEDIAGRAEALGPLGRGAADVLGFAGLTALTGGLGAEADVAGAAAKVPFGGALANILGTSLPARIAASSASMAAYEGAQQVSEMQIGDPSFNSEAVLAHIGLAGLLSGALEGVFGLAGQAIPAAVGAAKSSMGTLDEVMQKALTKGLVASGSPQEVIEASLKIAQEAAAAGKPVEEYMASDAAKANKDVVDALSTLRKNVVDGRNPASLSKWWTDNRMSTIAEALRGVPEEQVAAKAAELSKSLSDLLNVPDAEKIAHGFKPHAVANPLDAEGMAAQVEEADATPGMPPPTNIRYTEPAQFTAVRAIQENFNKAVSAAEGSDDAAFKIFQAADKARDDMGLLRYNENGLRVKGQLGKWVGDVQRSFANFTKSPEVFGDQIKPIWGDTQDAFHKMLDADKALVTGLGKGLKGAKVLSHDAFAKNFMEGAANAREGLGEASKTALHENWLNSVKDFTDKVEQAAQQTPKPYDTAATKAGLDALSEIKKSALAKYGLADAFNHLKGGKSLALGGLWLPSLILKHLGMPTPALPFVLGGYEVGRMVARPRATIAAYGQLANIVAKTHAAIGIGARGAARALTAVEFGANAAPRAAYYDAVEKGFRQSLLGGAKAASLQHAPAQHAQELASLGGPEDLGARLGHATSPLPPDTRQALMTKAAAQIALRKQINPIPPPTVGGWEQKASESDAWTHAQMVHLIDNPLHLATLVEEGRLRPDHVMISQSANPRLHAEMVSQIDDALAKRGMDSMGPQARATWNILHSRDAWPLGVAESTQIGYGMPAPDAGVQPVQDKQGRTGASTVTGEKISKLGKYEAESFGRRLPYQGATWKPTT